MRKHVDTDKVTIHGKVALTLLAAEHVAPLFAGHPETLDLVREVIAAGWSWIEERTPNPEIMYWRYNPKLTERELAYHDDARLLAAFHAVLDMHYYTAWKAEGVASYEQPDVVYSIGNDVADVDESYLENCLENVIKASGRPDETTAWLEGLVDRMEAEFFVRDDDEIGDKPRRASFDVPPITP
jgi:hypothetical protein